PPVVTAIFNNINLLIAVLPHITGPQAPVLSVKTESPRITQPIGIDFFPVPVIIPGKRVIPGDPVLDVPFRIIYIDTKDRPQQRRAVLSMPFRVTACTTVPHRNKQKTLRTE